MTSPDDIAALNEFAAGIAAALKVAVAYKPPLHSDWHGDIAIGDPWNEQPLTTDGAATLANALNALGIDARWFCSASSPNAADCVTISSMKLATPEQRGNTLAIIVGHQDDLRKTLEAYDLEAQVFRDTLEVMRQHKNGFTVATDLPGDGLDQILPRPKWLR